MSKNIKIIGIGNEYRGDDGIGPFIAKKLIEENIGNIQIAIEQGEGTKLIDLWSQCDLVILIDAINSNSDLGKIHKLDGINGKISQNFYSCSTHLFSIPDAIELSRNLSTLPKKLLIIGIEGKNFNYGADISTAVLKSSSEVIKLIKEEINSYILKMEKENA